jgi:hypothetical protein
MISNADRLVQFQLWLIDADDRALDDIGLTPANIIEAINGVLGEAETKDEQIKNLVGILELCVSGMNEAMIMEGLDFYDELNQHKQQNAELIDMLERLTSHDNCKKDVVHLMGEADGLLSKIKGE